MSNSDELLEARIRDLVDRVKRMAAEDIRNEIFKLVKEYQLAETQDARLTLSDLNRIRDAATQEMQNLSHPLYISGQQANELQRVTYCYLMAIVGVLRSLELLRRTIDADKEQPLYYSVHEE